jgi:hypothetical protein
LQLIYSSGKLYLFFKSIKNSTTFGCNQLLGGSITTHHIFSASKFIFSALSAINLVFAHNQLISAFLYASCTASGTISTHTKFSPTHIFNKLIQIVQAQQYKSKTFHFIFGNISFAV